MKTTIEMNPDEIKTIENVDFLQNLNGFDIFVSEVPFSEDANNKTKGFKILPYQPYEARKAGNTVYVRMPYYAGTIEVAYA